MTIKCGEKEYEITFGSDVDKDGFFAELTERGKLDLLLYAFWCDGTGAFTFSAYQEDLPFELVEIFVSEARKRLPPINETHSILVDFYPGAYGPTIRIILNTPQQLHAFLDILRSLASNEGVTIVLEQLPNFALSGIGSFVFETGSSTRKLPKHLTVSDGQNPSVVWKQTRTDWKLAADLIEVFTTSDEPGHHYLTDEGTDDALVEVAYRE